MQPTAFVRPLGPTTLHALRVLTRLALTALVLTLTFGAPAGTSADPAPATAYQLQPAVTTGVPQPAIRPVVAQVAYRPVDEQAGQGRPPVLPTGEPGTAGTAGVPLRPPAADPGQGLPGWRAPPRA